MGDVGSCSHIKPVHIFSLSHMRDMLSRRFFRLAFGACALLFVGGLVIILAALFPAITVSPVVSLHYNIHFGVDAVGAWWRLFVPSFVALVLTLCNAAYAARMWQREHVIAYAFGVTAVLVNVFVLLHIVFIVLLNFTSLQ